MALCVDRQADSEAEVLRLMRDAASSFIAALRAAPGTMDLPAPEQPSHGAGLLWKNTLFKGPGFRRAHVELLEIENHFAVVHVVALPHLNQKQPIFGFDMVAGHAQATGIFLDFSPVTRAPPNPCLSDAVPAAVRASFTHARTRPPWGTIFSPEFFAIRPNGLDEVRAAIGLAGQAFAYYLRHLIPAPSAGPASDEAVLEGHVAYARGQRLNPHTERMLARFVGAVPARAFIEDVLFPMPD